MIYARWTPTACRGRGLAKRLRVSRSTVAKYADMEDMSPEPPLPERRRRPALEDHEAWVESVPGAGLGAPRKQRHTAKRVFAGSCSTGGGREDLVLMGDVGTGKTYVASALCALACEKRLKAEEGPRREQARPGGRADWPRPPARHRRAQVPVAGRRRRRSGLPGLRRRLRDPAGGDHDEPLVQQVGTRSSATTRWRRPSSTAQPATAGSSSSATSPTACGTSQCRRGRFSSSVRAGGAHAAQILMTTLLKSFRQNTGVLRHGVPAHVERSGGPGPRAPGGVHRPYIIHCVQGHGHLPRPSRAGSPK